MNDLTMNVYIRPLGAPNAQENILVDWPESARVPVAGDLVTTSDLGTRRVISAEWHLMKPDVTGHRRVGVVHIRLGELLIHEEN